MKAIILSGKASSGKTTTLKMLIAMLIDNGAVIVWCRRNPYHPTSQSLWNEITHEMQNHILPKELTVVLKYKGKLIGIRSFGDVYSDATCAIKFFKQHKCDIGVLPCHPDSDAQKLLKKVYIEDTAIFEKEKLPREANDVVKWDVNISMAKILLEEIDKIIPLLP